ncbi:MAG TPA: YdeI/OmpD-associated family protein [Verrucomicrobiae bacterium]|nr:YdeI/OmpD-associated family protein [Verrucomicrobiae bacterium]
MGRNPRIDAYIAKSADFAKPILSRVRKLIHAVCPRVEETLKWKTPFYLHEGILLGTPAFKQHCALIFWKGRLFLGKERQGLRRLKSAADLPSDRVLRGYLRQAIALNESGGKNPGRTRPAAKKPVAVPSDFRAALKKNKKALAAFDRFSPSCRREYLVWITGAKQAETRVRRIKTALEWIAAGKSYNWKYRR